MAHLWSANSVSTHEYVESTDLQFQDAAGPGATLSRIILSYRVYQPFDFESEDPAFFAPLAVCLYWQPQGQALPEIPNNILPGAVDQLFWEVPTMTQPNMGSGSVTGA